MRNFEAKQEDINAAVEELFYEHDENRIDELAKNYDIKVQQHVIFNAYVSAKTLDRVARKAPNFENKLLWIADHANTSPETLEWIYKRSQGTGLMNTLRKWFSPASPEKEEEIRKSLAKNENTPDNIIRNLTKDNSAGVRLALTLNPKVPTTVRETLLTDLVSSSDPEMKLEVLDREELPASVRSLALTELCFDKNSELWKDLASFKHLDADSVKTLLLKGDSQVKKELFTNRHLPAGSYELMSQEHDFHLLELLGDNSGVPDTVLESLATTSIEALKEMERLKQYTLVAIAVASNPSTPKSALEAFADMHPAAKNDGALPGVVAPEEKLANESIPAQLRYLALHNPNYKK